MILFVGHPKTKMEQELLPQKWLHAWTRLMQTKDKKKRSKLEQIICMQNIPVLQFINTLNSCMHPWQSQYLNTYRVPGKSNIWVRVRACLCHLEWRKAWGQSYGSIVEDIRRSRTESWHLKLTRKLPNRPTAAKLVN